MSNTCKCGALLDHQHSSNTCIPFGLQQTRISKFTLESRSQSMYSNYVIVDELSGRIPTYEWAQRGNKSTKYVGFSIKPFVDCLPLQYTCHNDHLECHETDTLCLYDLDKNNRSCHV